MDETIQKLIEKLRNRNMAGYSVNNKTELIELIKELIPEGSTVGCGDSVTLEQTGVFELLRNGTKTRTILKEFFRRYFYNRNKRRDDRRGNI